MRFRAANILNGSAIVTPTTVPINAICIVSSIDQNAVPNKLGSTSVISLSTIAKLGIPFTNSAGFASILYDITIIPAITNAIIRLFLGFITIVKLHNFLLRHIS